MASAASSTPTALPTAAETPELVWIMELPASCWPAGSEQSAELAAVEGGGGWRGSSLDISHSALRSLLACDDGRESPHHLVVALLEGSACIIAGRRGYPVSFDNFVRLLMKYRG